VRRFALLLIAQIIFSMPGSATEQNAKTGDVIASTLPPARRCGVSWRKAG
jgi:hypothetical protein